jgi:Anti-sigma factor NepR
MHSQAAIRKAGGRLSREDQRRLGDILQRVYDDVVRQGVPDRFRNLMDELEDDPRRGDVGNALAPQQAQGGRDPESDRVVAAKSFPHDKGSSQ